jgi:mitochondrial fission protein ELM1
VTAPAAASPTLVRSEALRTDVQTSPTERAPPRVWAVMCYRAGENSQIRALADALGWPYEEKRLHYRWWGYLADVWRGTKLAGIDRRRSSPLQAPWPDLIVSAAMRNEPVCRWIRRASGGRARYVHLGKPWAAVSSFDLVITVPEYPVPDRPNVLRNSFSLHAVNDDRLAAEARTWAPRLAHLPRPYVAVLVGGYSGRYAFDQEKAERLGREASALVRGQGGSLLVTTSGRTSPAAASALERAIDVPCEMFRWTRDAADNPFFGYLALADAIVVTCESATMLAEACATRKPVHIFDLDWDLDPAMTADESWPTRLQRYALRYNLQRLKAWLYREVFLRVAPRKITRDITRVHDLLIASGRAVWLGQPFPASTPPVVDDLARSVQRVRALVEEPVPARSAARSVAEPAAGALHPPLPGTRQSSQGLA